MNDIFIQDDANYQNWQSSGLSKSEGYTRSSYPFITDNGSRTLFTDAIDDMALWVPIGFIPVIYSDATVDNDILTIIFYDKDKSFELHAKYHIDSKDTDGSTSGVVEDTDGRISGLVKWNKEGCTKLMTSIISRYKYPDIRVQVNPCVCIPYEHPPLSIVKINGVLQRDSVVKVHNESYPDIEVSTDPESYNNFLNIFGDRDATDSQEAPITHIKFSNVRRVYTVNDSDSISPASSNIPVAGRHIWLLSEDTCDIRIKTSDVIDIMEISKNE